MIYYAAFHDEADVLQRRDVAAGCVDGGVDGVVTCLVSARDAVLSQRAW